MPAMPDGEIINQSFSTRAPRIRVSRWRLLRYGPASGCMTRLLVVLALPTAVAALLGWTVLSVIGLVLCLPALGVLLWVSAKEQQLCQHALLTPGVVVGTAPLRIAVLADMDTGFQDSPVWAIKVIEPGKLPGVVLEEGALVPCVSGFTGERIEYHEDFSPTPLACASADLEAIARDAERFDADELAVLRNAIQDGGLPEPGEVRWLGGEPGAAAPSGAPGTRPDAASYFYTQKEAGLCGLALDPSQAATMDTIVTGPFEPISHETYWKHLARYMVTHAPQGYVMHQGSSYWLIGNCGRILGPRVEQSEANGINVLRVGRDRSFAYRWYVHPFATAEDERDPVYDLTFTPWDWLLDGEGDERMFVLDEAQQAHVAENVDWTDALHGELEQRWPADQHWKT